MQIESESRSRRTCNIFQSFSFGFLILHSCGFLSHRFRDWPLSIYGLSRRLSTLHSSHKQQLVVLSATCFHQRLQPMVLFFFGWVTVQTTIDTLYPFMQGCKKAVIARLFEQRNANIKHYKKVCLFVYKLEPNCHPNWHLNPICKKKKKELLRKFAALIILHYIFMLSRRFGIPTWTTSTDYKQW